MTKKPDTAEIHKELKIFIVSAEKKVNPYGGLVTLQCTMSDGSVWSCKTDGSNFVIEVPPLKLLNECFQQQLKK